MKYTNKDFLKLLLDKSFLWSCLKLQRISRQWEGLSIRLGQNELHIHSQFCWPNLRCQILQLRKRGAVLNWFTLFTVCVLSFLSKNKLAIALVAWEGGRRWSCKTRKTAPFRVGGGGIKLSGLETRIRTEVRISFALQRAEKIIWTTYMS